MAAAVVIAGCSNAAGQSSAQLEPHPGAITAGPETQVTTTAGTYEGFLDGDVYTFRGIQYAKAERFMPPQDPDKFEGVRMAKLYGPKAPQSETLRWNEANSQTDYGFGNNFVMEPMDEKGCLVLNVWTKGLDNGKRPVFVWIHGGGFSTGSGHDLPCYEGRSLAEKGDIVVVNLNHRLNVLGYMDLTALGGKYSKSVNLGMQDLVKALEWIHNNIAKFGGDPSRVTIGGQSGGGGKVSVLLSMPSAKGLFSQAVIQSGSTLRIGEKANAEKYAAEFVRQLGVAPGPNADFSKFTYDELVDASRRAADALGGNGPRVFGKGARYGAGPVADGEIVPDHPFDPVAPAVSKDVPLLIGTNFNEFSFAVDETLPRDKVIAELGNRMGTEKASEFVKCFEKTFPKLPEADMLYMDISFRTNSMKQAEAKALQGGANAYQYLFNWRPNVNVLAASHGMELPFMFNNVALQREMTGGEERAYALEKIISDAWLSFIKTGKPAAEGMPEWEPYNVETRPMMVLDDACTLEHNLDTELLEIANR